VIRRAVRGGCTTNAPIGPAFAAAGGAMAAGLVLVNRRG
jgi:hypothetical protein